MAGPASEYHRGDQDIRDQLATFHLFIGMTKWGSLYLAAVLLWLVIWFCTPAGFFPGLITAIVAIAVGTLVLAEKRSSTH